jgi:hypothetical protein
MSRAKTGPTVPWPSLKQCTLLGVALVEWMWAQKPPVPVALLASRVGVERTTLHSWLTTERKPHPTQLLLLSQVTELPALGLARVTEIPAERALRQRDALWDDVEWEVGRMEGAAAGETEALLKDVRSARRCT